MARQASMEELLKGAIWNQLERVNTCLPCIVVNVHDELIEQIVDVQPVINIFDQNGKSEQQAPILTVPVVMPATSTSAITMPVNIGDTVLCVFSQRALEVFQESDGKPSTPNNYARFHKKDAIAIVGLFPKRNAINNPSKRTHSHSTQDLAIAHNIGKTNEVEIRFKPNGDMIVNTPAKVEVNCNTASITADTSITVDSPTTNWTGDVNLTGDITMSGTLTAIVDVLGGGKSLKTHTHGGVMSGGAMTTPPT